MINSVDFNSKIVSFRKTPIFIIGGGVVKEIKM